MKTKTACRQNAKAAHSTMHLVLAGLALLAMVATSEAQTYRVGDIKIVSFNTVPVHWMECNGQTLPISAYSTLFGLIGTTYGGDGTTTLALPNLNGRIAPGAGQGSGLSNYSLGQSGGQSTVTLTISQIPSHTHVLMADSAAGTSVSPSGLGIARNAAGIPMFATTATGSMISTAMDSTGSSQPHNNMMPYLGLKFIIAVQ
ncbi:MAG TPA: tail fiber protein [Bacteroidota bacterium]|nr:tail fiber protein [Bacteroidota bacterium]